MRKLTVGALVGFLVFASQAAFAYNYVSLAGARLTNPDGSPRGRIGTGRAYNAFTAESLAIQDCAYQGCSVLQTSTGCIAAAYDNNKRVMAQSGPDSLSAQYNVLNYCQSSSNVGGCVLWTVVCAN